MKNPLKVTLEAECHTYKDALALQDMLTDFVAKEELAGEYISYAEIDYVEPEKLNVKQKKIVDEFQYEQYNRLVTA